MNWLYDDDFEDEYDDALADRIEEEEMIREALKCDPEFIGCDEDEWEDYEDEWDCK